MKTLGIIGGTGPESTIDYCRRLSAAYRERSPEGRALSIVINSIDNKKLLDLVGANELTLLADYLQRSGTARALRDAVYDAGCVGSAGPRLDGVSPHRQILSGDIQDPRDRG